jgi:hypothetical protein
MNADRNCHGLTGFILSAQILKPCNRNSWTIKSMSWIRKAFSHTSRQHARQSSRRSCRDDCWKALRITDCVTDEENFTEKLFGIFSRKNKITVMARVKCTLTKQDTRFPIFYSSKRVRKSEKTILKHPHLKMFLRLNYCSPLKNFVRMS